MLRRTLRMARRLSCTRRAHARNEAREPASADVVRRSRGVTVVLCIVLAACGGGDRKVSDAYEVTAQYPHDSAAYTQGLLWADSVLFESTGQYGHSDVRR